MKKYTIFLFMIVLGLSTSCIEEFNPQISDEDDNHLVVEGNIVSDSLCVFHLSHTSSLQNVYDNTKSTMGTSSLAVTNAQIAVVGSDGTKYPGYLGEEAGSYLVDLDHLKSDVKYSLQIEYDGNSYESEPAVPLATPDIEEVTFKQAGQEDPVEILISAEKTSEPTYFQWDYKETWEVISTYYTNYYYDIYGNMKRYDMDISQGWKYGDQGTYTLGNSNQFTNNHVQGMCLYKIGYQDDRISVMYRTIITQRAISKDQFEYNELNRKQSEEMGGLFSPQPSELPTNIICKTGKKKALGFVGVSQNVVQRVVYIYGIDVFYKSPFKCISEDHPVGEYEDPMGRGLMLALREPTPIDTEHTWAPMKCVDVRELGASLERPEDWP